MTEAKGRDYFGSCLCGAVKYKVRYFESRTANCHCSMCRKFHGAAFATFGEAKAENFQWMTGQELLKSYTAQNKTTRQFCGVCGSSLTFSPANDSHQFVEFTLGTMDSEVPVKPDAHIYVGYKANWLELNDHLPKFTEGRDSERVKD